MDRDLVTECMSRIHDHLHGLVTDGLIAGHIFEATGGSKHFHPIGTRLNGFFGRNLRVLRSVGQTTQSSRRRGSGCTAITSRSGTSISGDTAAWTVKADAGN